MATKIIVTAAGILVIAAVVYVDRRSARTEINSLRSAVERQDVAARRERPAPITFTLPPAGGTARAGEQPAEAAVAPPAEAAPSERAPEPAAPQSPIEAFEPMYNTLEARFTGEVMDGGWARDAKHNVNAKLSTALPEGSRVEAVDCRSTLCRIESTHDGMRRAREFVHTKLSNSEALAWNGAYATGPVAEDKSSGRLTLVTYFMREGQELPMPEETQ